MNGGKKGFTIPELLVIMGIFATLMGVATINLLKTQSTTYLTTTVDTLIADIKSQQNKAITGDTEGRASSDSYGIYFEENGNTYTLFHGTYDPNEPSNFVVTLEGQLEFVNVLFPQDEIRFEQSSGEIMGFSDGLNSITLQDPSNGATKTIEFNKYGTVTQVN